MESERLRRRKRQPRKRRLRPVQHPSWAGRLVDAWLLQHYARAVWRTSGLHGRSHPPPFANLAGTAVPGQVMMVFNSVLLLTPLPFSGWLGICALNGLGALWAFAHLSGLLAKRALRQRIPSRFLRLDIDSRRRWALAGRRLWWATVGGLVAAVVVRVGVAAFGSP